MRLLLLALAALVMSASAAAQPYASQHHTGLDHDALDRGTHDCTTTPVNLVANCSFETGDFADWIPQDITDPFDSLEVNGAGISPGFGLFTSAPTNGAFAALTGFDGGGPGVIRLSQDVTADAGFGIGLRFDYRAGWDLATFGATLDRTFQVVIEPSGGGTPLDTFVVLTAAAGTMQPDTGDLEASLDLSAYLGSSFRLVFEWVVPESFTGPAFFQLDNIDLDDMVPVELVRFEPLVNGTDVTLDWATASETNNAGFEVQMRRETDWAAIGFVEGHGTTTEARTYSYTATDLSAGTHTFRLRQVDFDGTFSYSPEVEVVVGTPGTHTLSAVYPNPFNPQAQFDLAVAQEQHVTAALYNALGQRVATLLNGPVEANATRTLTVDGSGLASGLYVVRVVGETFTDARRITLLK